MKKKHRTILLISALLIAAVFVAMRFIGANSGSAAGAGAQGQGRGGAPIHVETAQTSIRAMTDVRDFTGTVKASYMYVISAKVPGRLLTINKRIGDAVRANEQVGRIDDTDYKNTLAEVETQIRVSRASLEEATAQLAHLERELVRSRGLMEKGIASQAELDALSTQAETQRSRHELAKAQLEQRQVLLAQARTNVANTILRASEAGLVAQRHVDGGTLMSVGAPILTIVGLDTVFVELAVSERDYRNLQPGKEATVTVDAVPNVTFEGFVYKIAPFFNAATRTAAVEIALKNEGHLLKPGMFARISVMLGEDGAARVVPTSALVERGGDFSVFVVSDSATVSNVPVTVGINDGTFAQILSPPNFDATVVTLGQHLLRQGSRVIVSNRDGD